MPLLGGNYNPAQVMMRTSTNAHTIGNQPYIAQQSQAVRPTGPTGGYDPAYLQNLTSYTLGQFQPGQGTQYLNPLNSGNQFGVPTGGGNAPLGGMPNTLLAQAQANNPQAAGQMAYAGGGAPGATAATPPNTGSAPSSNQVLSMPDWLNQMLQQGSSFGLNGITGGISGY